jgi:hypothetical protein
MPTVHAADQPYTGEPIGPGPEFVPTPGFRIPAATPAAFGAGVGEAVRGLGTQLGQSANELAQNVLWQQELHNRITADDQNNKFLEEMTQKLRTGPDALFTKEGDDFLKAYPAVMRDLEATRQRYASSLNLQARTDFNRMSLYYTRVEFNQIGAHADAQQKTYAANVAKDSADIHLRGIGTHPNDPDAVEADIAALMKARLDHEEIQNGKFAGDPNAATRIYAVEGKTRADATTAQIEAIAPDNVDGAKTLFEQAQKDGVPFDTEHRLRIANQIITGENRAEAAANRREREQKKADAAAYTRWLLGGMQGPPPEPGAAIPRGGGGPSEEGAVTKQQVSDEARKQGLDPVLANAAADIESSHGATRDTPGSQYQGVFQLGEKQRGGPKGSLQHQVEQGIQVLAGVKSELGAKLGKEPEPWQTYLAHQQGATGLAALLAHPNDNAAQVITDATGENGKANITGNVPTALKEQAANWTAKQFTDYWHNRYQSYAAKYADQAGPGTTTAAVPGGPDRVVTPLPPVTVTAAAAAGGPDEVVKPQPIPTGTKPAEGQAPADALRPDFEKMEQQALSIPDDDTSRMVLSQIRAAQAHWTLTHATELRQLGLDIKNTIAQRMIGQDVPDVDEKRIRHLLPKDKADDAIESLDDAKILGSEFEKANTQTLPEIVQERARLAATKGVPGVHDVTERVKGAQAYQQQSQKVIEGMQKDPAGWQSTNDPTLRDQHDAVFQMPVPQGDQDWATYTKAHEDYVNAQLAKQQHWGLPDEAQHALNEVEAKGMASQLMRDPANAPQLLRGMQREWGAAWPRIWADMVNIGKLPFAYQAIGVIPNAGQMVGGMPAAGQAETLARALGEPDTAGDRWKTLLGETVTGQGSASIWYDIKNNRPEVKNLLDSMAQGLAAKGDEAEMVHGIQTLAYGNMVYNHMDQKAATDAAVAAFTGQYEYPLAGGARIPKSRVTEVVANVTDRVERASEDNLAIPSRFRATADKSRPDLQPASDYVALEKAHPLWINNTTGDGIIWVDHGGRPIYDRQGNPFVVKFDDSAPLGWVPPAQRLGEPVPGTQMPF